MKRGVIVFSILLMSGLLALWAFDGVGTAYADGGPPHTNNIALTDYCAACHKAHTAEAADYLLKQTDVSALCATCHNGTGSRLDVMDGMKLDANKAARPTWSGTAWQVSGVDMAASAFQGTLLGGGFEYVGVVAASAATIAASPGGISAANPTVVTTTAAHNFNTGDRVTIAGSTSTPSINGTWTVTVLTATTFTVPVNVTAAGGGGTATRSGAQNSVTSTHLDVTANAVTTAAAATSDEPWGYAGIGANRTTYAAGTAVATKLPGVRAANASISALACASCHNPHGGPNYRMLKDSINGYAVNVKARYSGATVKDEGGAGFTGTPPADKYTKEYYYSGGANILTSSIADADANVASLCSACHTAYPSNDAMVGLSDGTTTRYRHKTEASISGQVGPGGARCGNASGTGGCTHPETTGLGGYTLRLASTATTADGVVTCLTCHRAHGTAAAMSGSYTSGTTATQTGGGVAADSSLLYLNQRGVCQVCHQW